MRSILPRLSAVALAVALSGAAAYAQQAPAAGRGIDVANLDTTCAACRDFYQYANGGWLTRSTIPAAYSVWGSFNELSDKNNEVLHTILEEARTAKAAPGTNVQKVGTYYGTCMDTTAIEAEGTRELQPILRQIDALKSPADLKRNLGKLERLAGLAPFSFGATPDAKNSTMVVAGAGQGGLGMPERDYYFRTDSNSVKLRAAYLDHVTKILQLSGETESQAAADAQRVMSFEMRLAGASKSRVQLRDPNANYNKMTLAELQASTPNIAWNSFLADLGAKNVSTVIVGQPAFLKTVDSMMTGVPLADWKAYMRYHASSAAAGALGSAWEAESFRWQQNLTGAKTQLPRWRRCAAATNGALGEALGQVYVERTFTPEAKARALEMVNNLRDALRDRIGALAWMSDSTKQQALTKLDAFTRKIGYPDKWKDYSKLQIKPGSYAANVRSAMYWGRDDNLSRIGKPVDKTEWGMTPPTVNAYYNPLYNEIVFPAGILQPPFFDPKADDAVNYGGMGAVIGHEMTHGFDDQGRQFDASGNLRDWWTAKDAESYKQRATLVADQFSGYTVVDTATRVNGRLTLGENIADLGGLTIALAALEKSYEKKGRPANVDGFTPEQRFFLSWAQVWRQLQRPEAARTQVLTDPHAPGRWRVNGPLSNMPEFAKAFGCKQGDPMVRADALRAQIW